MKKGLFIISILFFLLDVKAQTIANSSFYKSFQRNFRLVSPIDTLIPKHYFSSLLLKTDNQGKIIQIQMSLSTDSVIKKSLQVTYQHLDMNGLQGFDLNNASLIVPVFIFNVTPSVNIQYNEKQLDIERIWDFKHIDIHKECIKLLPPITIYIKKGHNIIN